MADHGEWGYSRRVYDIEGLPEESLEDLDDRDRELEYQLDHLYGKWRDWSVTGTNYTLGNGVIIGRYRLVGNTFQYFIYFRLGSTSAVATDPKFFLPVGMTLNTHVFDTGGGRYRAGTGTGVLYDSDANTYYNVNTIAADSGRNVITTRILYGAAKTTSSSPFTWATSDDMTFSGTLELDNTTAD